MQKNNISMDIIITILDCEKILIKLFSNLYALPKKTAFRLLVYAV